MRLPTWSEWTKQADPVIEAVNPYLNPINAFGQSQIKQATGIGATDQLAIGAIGGGLAAAAGAGTAAGATAAGGSLGTGVASAAQGTGLGVGLTAAASAAANYWGATETNQANQAISREQMQFQERMSSSSYQRATADMKAAGLNPALAYSQGGASSPAGAGIAAINRVAPAITSAMEVKMMAADLDQKMAMTENTRSQTAQTNQNIRQGGGKSEIYEDIHSGYKKLKKAVQSGPSLGTRYTTDPKTKNANDELWNRVRSTPSPRRNMP